MGANHTHFVRSGYSSTHPVWVERRLDAKTRLHACSSTLCGWRDDWILKNATRPGQLLFDSLWQREVAGGGGGRVLLAIQSSLHPPKVGGGYRLKHQEPTSYDVGMKKRRGRKISNRKL